MLNEFDNTPDLVPARMVNEYVYCPRLAYIEWVQADFADNYDVAEGRFRHRRVDEERVNCLMRSARMILFMPGRLCCPRLMRTSLPE